MTTEKKVARRKLSMLELATELGNVSKACKVMGYSRQQFYEIRRDFQLYGAEGLLDKLPDSQGQYLWVPGLLKGEPDRLLAYPVLICEDMPDVAGNANAVAVGDFRAAYTIVDRTTRILRDPYTNKPNVMFYTTKRVSGALVNDQAVKVLRINNA